MKIHHEHSSTRRIATGRSCWHHRVKQPDEVKIGNAVALWVGYRYTLLLEEILQQITNRSPAPLVFARSSGWQSRFHSWTEGGKQCPKTTLARSQNLVRAAAKMARIVRFARKRNASQHKSRNTGFPHYGAKA